MVTHATRPTGPDYRRERVWAGKAEGWPLFAAVVLTIAGVLRIFDSIWAFGYNGAVPDNLEKAIFGHNLETYGWAFLALGVVLIAAGMSVLQGSQVGRWTGVAAAAVGVWSGIWWMPYYPIWSVTYMALGVLVIYALTVHGGRSENY